MEPTQIRLTIPDSVDPTRLMGPADSLLRRIEQAFDAMVVVRGNTITISGAIEVVEQASTVFSRLMRQVDVDVVIEHVKHGAAGYSILSDDVLLTYRGRTIRPKTAGQKRYIDSIRSNTITFGIGPAGTGKTYLAMACAVAALKRREVGRIVLCRPVVEAGESLGFLPGTLEEKLAAVSEYLDGSVGMREIAERHGVDPAQISRWAKRYLRRGPEALRPKGKKGVPVSRRNDKVRPDPTPPPEQVPDEGLREYCEQLKFENDVLRAELDLFAKKAQASARKGSQTPRNRS